MPPFKVQVKCKKGHNVFLACYRNSVTIKRIRDLYYCPGCDEFMKLKGEKQEVTIT